MSLDDGELGKAAGPVGCVGGRTDHFGGKEGGEGEREREVHSTAVQDKSAGLPERVLGS